MAKVCTAREEAARRRNDSEFSSPCSNSSPAKDNDATKRLHVQFKGLLSLLRAHINVAEAALSAHPSDSHKLRAASATLVEQVLAADTELNGMLQALRNKSARTTDLAAAHTAVTSDTTTMVNDLNNAANMADMSRSLSESRQRAASFSTAGRSMRVPPPQFPARRGSIAEPPSLLPQRPSAPIAGAQSAPRLSQTGPRSTQLLGPLNPPHVLQPHPLASVHGLPVLSVPPSGHAGHLAAVPLPRPLRAPSPTMERRTRRPQRRVL